MLCSILYWVCFGLVYGRCGRTLHVEYYSSYLTEHLKTCHIIYECRYCINSSLALLSNLLLGISADLVNDNSCLLSDCKF
jgi:hypothetical protein